MDRMELSDRVYDGTRNMHNFLVSGIREIASRKGSDAENSRSFAELAAKIINFAGYKSAKPVFWGYSQNPMFRAHGPQWQEPSNPLYIRNLIRDDMVSVIMGLSKEKSEPGLRNDFLNDTLTGTYDTFTDDNVKRFILSSLFKGRQSQIVVNHNSWYRHSVFPFMSAYVPSMYIEDGIMTVPVLVLEVSGDRKEEVKNGKIPEGDFLRAQHIMSCINSDTLMIAYGWGLKDGEMKLVSLKREVSAEELLVSSYLSFLNSRLKSTGYTLRGVTDVSVILKDIKASARDVSEPSIVLPSYLANSFEHYFSVQEKVRKLKEQLKEEEKNLSEAEVFILGHLGQSPSGVLNLPGISYSVEIKEQERVIADSKKLKEDNIFQNYSKKITSRFTSIVKRGV